LRLALRALDSLDPAPDWTWGGGTALASHLAHRTSHDIDLFLPDTRALRDLHPARNAVVRGLSENIQVPGHYVKIVRPKGEIDFIAAPLLTAPGFGLWEFEGRAVQRETVAEILAKKLRWRGSRAPARDVFDLLAAERWAPEDFKAAVEAEPEGARRVADGIRAGLSRLKKELPGAIDPTDRGRELFEADLLELAAALDRQTKEHEGGSGR